MTLTCTSCNVQPIHAQPTFFSVQQTGDTTIKPRQLLRPFDRTDRQFPPRLFLAQRWPHAFQPLQQTSRKITGRHTVVVGQRYLAMRCSSGVPVVVVGRFCFPGLRQPHGFKHVQLFLLFLSTDHHVQHGPMVVVDVETKRQTFDFLWVDRDAQHIGHAQSTQFRGHRAFQFMCRKHRRQVADIFVLACKNAKNVINERPGQPTLIVLRIKFQQRR